MRVSLIMLAVFLALAPQAPAAEATKVGDVIIHDAWVRTPLDVDKSSAVYMALEVGGDQADRLLAAETSVAEKAELRTYWLEGCFTNTPLVEAIEVSPGKQTALNSGGLHIQLVGVRRPLVEGKTIPLTLTFEKAGSVEIEVLIQEQRRLPGGVQGQDIQASTN
jgi:copper(I)-binding protein